MPSAIGIRTYRCDCCADLHLGRESSLIYEPADGANFERTPVGAWRRIVDLAIEENAAAVVIAGDVFDGDSAAFQTRHLFAKELKRLKENDIPVVAVAGNHDCRSLPDFAATEEGRWLVLLGKGGSWQCEVLRLQERNVAFVGWSFAKPSHTVNPFTLPLPQLPLGVPAVGVLHADLATGSLYAPIDKDALNRLSVDAWVLGHIHKPTEVGPRAIYPGSPQALDFGPGERGAHGVYWLRLDSQPNFEPMVPLSSVFFDEVEIDIGDGSTCFTEAADVEREIDSELTRQAAEYRNASRYLECAQLRATVRVMNCIGQLPPAIEPRLAPNGADAWEAMRVVRLNGKDSWEYAALDDAPGQVSRLLVGLLGRDGLYAGKPVDTEWFHSAASLVERCAGDLDSIYRGTVAAGDDGRHERIAPSREELCGLAQEMVEARLREMLRTFELKQEQAL